MYCFNQFTIANTTIIIEVYSLKEWNLLVLCEWVTMNLLECNQCISCKVTKIKEVESLECLQWIVVQRTHERILDSLTIPVALDFTMEYPSESWFNLSRQKHTYFDMVGLTGLGFRARQWVCRGESCFLEIIETDASIMVEVQFLEEIR